MSTLIYRMFLICMLLEPLGQAQRSSPKELVDSITSTLREQRKGGGIVEIAGCSVASTDESQTSDGNQIHTKLDRLAKTNAIGWTEVGGIYFIQIPPRGSMPLTELRLPAIVVPDGNLVAASGLIMQNDLVQTKIKKSHVQLYDRSVGFSSLSSEQSPSHKTVTIPEGTVAKDLNWLASRYPGAIWLLRQTSCHGKQVLSLSWLSR